MTLPWAALLDALKRADLLVSAPRVEPRGITSLTADSRAVTPGAVYLAIRGSQADGHRFVADAASRGAVAAVVEAAQDASLPQVVVRDGRRAAVVLARAWYGDPAARLTLAGITGTNGKTTTTALLRHLLNERGTAGSIGTLGAFDGEGQPVESTAGSLTTPGPVDLQATFAALAARGVETVAMETSSHSLDQGRLDGLTFQAGVFTNLTRDHLDYHGTMEAYLAAKLRLLRLLATDGAAVVNIDDSAWRVVPAGTRTISFGLAPDADVRATGLHLGASGSDFRIEGCFGAADVRLPLLGDFNVSNALAAAAAALALG
ncbi:MAG: Mur ligase family protein, partial [Gemmatimonadota bacterium]|nr:Mur ligase family protein [Gemmatimonadota bacterium]